MKLLKLNLFLVLFISLLTAYTIGCGTNDNEENSNNSNANNQDANNQDANNQDANNQDANNQDANNQDVNNQVTNNQENQTDNLNNQTENQVTNNQTPNNTANSNNQQNNNTNTNANNSTTSTCDKNGFNNVVEIAEFYEDVPQAGDYWYYQATNGNELPLDFISMYIITGYGAQTAPGTYDITANETNLKDCGFCMVFYSNCNANAQGDLECEKLFMPKQEGTYTIEHLGREVDDFVKVTLNDIVLREVTINYDTYETTTVSDGDTWCLDEHNINGLIIKPGLVEMDPPDDLTCEYPASPYYFLGPEPGETDPEPGVVPPMEWPGAYYDDEVTGFNIARFKCEHPEIKTLFFMISAGWCGACAQFYGQSVCNSGGLEEQLLAENAMIVYVVGETEFQSTPATNEYANTKMNDYGCSGGYRLSDTDNTAGKRVVWESSMKMAIPWSCAVRMSDMKLTHEQSDGYYLEYLSIARQNNQ